INPAATGSLSNTATVTPPGTVTDPDLSNNSATDTDTLTAAANLQITKTDNRAFVLAGSSDTYTIVVTNAGPSSVTGASVADAFSASFTGATYTATSTGGATGFTASGSGSINDTAVNLPVGSTITYVVTGTIAAGTTGSMSNTASVTAPAGVTEINLANNSATDVTVSGSTPVIDAQITKTDGTTVAVAGAPNSYIIVVSNNGSADISGAAVADTFPAAFTGVTYTATATGGATGFTTSGSGNINDTAVNLPVGSSIIYVASGTISPTAAGTLGNTATVTATGDVNTANNTSTDTDTLVAATDLKITKTDNRGFVLAGSSDTYTIVVTNAGPSSVTGASVTDTFPASFTGVAYTATATGGATGFTASGTGNISDTTVNLPVGSTITYVVTGTVATGTVGPLSNTATVTAPAGVTDLNPANNSATDVSVAGATAVIDAQITKTDGKLAAVPGTAESYTIVVSNNGSATITGAAVADTFPAAFTSVTYTSTATGGATSTPSSGSGNIIATVDLPVGSSITYVASGTIDPTATGTLSNTATVTATGDTNSANDSSTDTTTLVPATSAVDVGVVKTDVVSTAVPGQTTTYTIVVTNSGPNTATNVSVVDNLPAGVSSLIWSGNGKTNQSGAINDTIASLASGASVTYTVVAAINPAATGTLTNTVTVSAANDINSTNNIATDTDALTAQADLSVTKTGSPNLVIAGQNLTYTIVVTNNGSSDAQVVSLNDVIPTDTTFVSLASPAGWTSITPAVGGTGTITSTRTTLAAGSGPQTFTLVVQANATATNGETITNTATVAATTADANATNNAASTSSTVNATADVSVTKTGSTDSVSPGQSLTYTIVVANNGVVAAQNVSLSDLIPADTTFVSFAAPAGWTSTTPDVGDTGTVTSSNPSLAVGDSATFTLVVRVDPTAEDGSVISNTAAVTTDTAESDVTNNTSLAVDVNVTQAVLPECNVSTLNEPGALGSATLGDDADNPGSGVLIVTGTNKSDVILIEQRPANHSQIRVKINGHFVGIYNKSDVQRIVAFGLGGNDTITVGWVLEQDAVLFGGAGNDYLFGGAGKDQLDGGSGNDHLFGGLDDDALCGGDGNDFLYGQQNNDFLSGDAGNDHLFGEGGDDHLQGGIGNDYLYGGIGNDRLYGQAGNDFLFGEAGQDILVAGDGNDKLWGGAGRDLLIGGDGNDTLYGEGHDDMLVAGSTIYDNNEIALMSILSEWTSSNSYSTRVNNIRLGGGNNGGFTLDSATVLDDGRPDTLWGHGGQDWFLVGIKDKIRDKAANELVN
ncbi:MAG: DUF11 domain-containing protein, partial [Planctomycetales bacterium]|nr:DUF11 domain-containing protein [Planctomycetales bacterium]